MRAAASASLSGVIDIWVLPQEKPAQRLCRAGWSISPRNIVVEVRAGISRFLGPRRRFFSRRCYAPLRRRRLGGQMAGSLRRLQFDRVLRVPADDQKRRRLDAAKLLV